MIKCVSALLAMIVLYSAAVVGQDALDEKKSGQLICIAGHPSVANVATSSGLIVDAKAGYGFPRRREGTGNNVFIFNPKKPAWAAYDSRGRLVASGRASGGATYCRDVGRACRTPRGEFKIYRKGSVYCRSSKYPRPRGGAPMPHCMHFYRGYAIHGSPNVPNYNASHGCIRVLPKDAKWLHKNFMHKGTTVIVTPY